MMNTGNIDIGELRKENRKRSEDYYREYDQMIGDPLSEVIPRRKFLIDGHAYWLPEEMMEEPIMKRIEGRRLWDVVKEAGEEPTDKSIRSLFGDIMTMRMKYDFEFVCVMCLTIQDKITKADIPLRLNKGQRILVHEMETMRLNHVPIRIILTKARQWGGSTVTEMYMLWLQVFHYPNWHSAIVAKVNSQAINIRAMITKAVDNFPYEVKNLSIRPFEGMKDTKFIPERGCRLTIASSEKPENLRSFDFAMLHLSEVATWLSTAAKSGDDLAQALVSTVPYAEGTVVVMESTAKGVGGYFHDEWLYACSEEAVGEGKKVPVFVPWFKIAMYRKKISNMKKFISTMTDYNWWQWRQGATLEGINWYNNFKTASRWNDFQMRSEYPTTADEAFQTKSGKYFSDFMLETLRSQCCAPTMIGNLVGDAVIGEGALRNIVFEADDSMESEHIKVWISPEKYNHMDIKNRFLVIVDIGGLHYKSDNSVIGVFDRKGLINAHGAIERAAIWYGHIDHDILAWKAAQIASWYGDALLVIESNTIETKDRKTDNDIVYEGDHSYTVLNEIGEVYPNMYMRTTAPEKMGKTETMKIGWHMNKKTKYQAYDAYRSAVRDGYYIEHCNEAVNEASWLQLTGKGQIEAFKGRRDDMQDTTAVGVYIGMNDDEMPMPKIIDHSKKRKADRSVKGAASF